MSGPNITVSVLSPNRIRAAVSSGRITASVTNASPTSALFALKDLTNVLSTTFSAKTFAVDTHADAQLLSLKDRFTRDGVVLTDRVPAGSASGAGWGAKIQTALNSARTADKALIVPPGNYPADWTTSFGPIVSGAHTVLRGAGPQTRFVAPAIGSAANLMRVSNTGADGYTRYSDFVIDLSALGGETASGSALTIENANDVWLSGVMAVGLGNAGFRVNGPSTDAGSAENNRLFMTRALGGYGHGIAISAREDGGNTGLGPRPKYTDVLFHWSANNKGSGINFSGAEGTLILGSRFRRSIAAGYQDNYAAERGGNGQSYTINVANFLDGYYRDLRMVDGRYDIHSALIIRRAGHMGALFGAKDGPVGPVIFSNSQTVDPWRNVGWPTPTTNDDEEALDSGEDPAGIDVQQCHSMVLANHAISSDLKQEGMGLMTVVAGTTTVTVKNAVKKGSDYFCLDRRLKVPCFIHRDTDRLIGQLVTLGTKTYYDINDVALDPDDYATHGLLVNAASYSIQQGTIDAPALHGMVSEVYHILQPDELAFTTASGTITVSASLTNVTGVGTQLNKLRAGDYLCKSADRVLLGVAAADGAPNGLSIMLEANGLSNYAGGYVWVRPKKMDYGLYVAQGATNLHIDFPTILVANAKKAPARVHPDAMAAESVPHAARHIDSVALGIGQTKRIALLRPLKAGLWRSRIAYLRFTFLTALAGTSGVDYCRIDLRRLRPSTGAEVTITGATAAIDNVDRAAGVTVSVPLPATPDETNDLFLAGDILMIAIVAVGNGSTVPDLDLQYGELPW